MTELIEVTITPPMQAMLGLRLFMLSTHYRKPINYTKDLHQQAWKTLALWYDRVTPCEDDPPEDLLAALKDDMNTPLAIAHMHRYYKQKEGRKLYAALRFLGLLPTQDVEKAVIESAKNAGVAKR